MSRIRLVSLQDAGLCAYCRLMQAAKSLIFETILHEMKWGGSETLSGNIWSRQLEVLEQ
jgi:hypothetical protein